MWGKNDSSADSKIKLCLSISSMTPLSHKLIAMHHSPFAGLCLRSFFKVKPATRPYALLHGKLYDLYLYVFQCLQCRSDLQSAKENRDAVFCQASDI